jgi:cyclopropane fatty-acyl-phospholipid synthase-like methyltransferase
MSWLRRLNFWLLYLGLPPWDTQESPPELLEFITQHPPGRALDLGCGTGTNVITMAQHGWQVTGIDFVGRALNQARIKAQQIGVTAEFLIDDVTELRLTSGKFDLILDIGCFHSLSEGEKLDYLNNLERLTGPGSFYLLYGFISEAEKGGPGIREPDLKAFEKNFLLFKREEGTDRGQRPSVWLTYQRKPVE